MPTIFCLGKNYPLHALEMGSQPPTEPIIFIKPYTSLNNKNKISVPAISNDMHYEVELVCRIADDINSISESDAMQFIDAYAIGIDFTLRDIQAKAKEKGNPWAVAKGFINSAPVGEFISSSNIKNPHDLVIQLKKNNELKQQCNTNEMIFKIPFIVSYLSKIFSLQRGDLIFTGTPDGVGSAVLGDKFESSIVGYENSILKVEVI